MSQKPILPAACDSPEPVSTEDLRRLLLAAQNPPGQSSLRYRVGTHASFMAAMLARMPRVGVRSDGPRGTGPDVFPLAALTARATDDPAIALLDAWACIGDILTFYQERFANEGYLRTATERRSLVELGNLVGYKPRPGACATTTVAFFVAGPDSPVKIPKGSALQSIPKAAEEEKPKTPQTFETTEDLSARPEWNEVQVTESSVGVIEKCQMTLAGMASLRPNDPILVTSLVPEGDVKPPDQMVLKTAASEPSPLRLVETFALYRVAKVILHPENATTQVTLKHWQGEPCDETLDSITSVEVLRARAVPFGATAPLMPTFNSGKVLEYVEWPLEPPEHVTGFLQLDREYDQVSPGSRLVIDRPGKDPRVVRVKGTRLLSVSAYGMTGRVTELELINGRATDQSEQVEDWLEAEDLQPIETSGTKTPASLKVVRSIAIYAEPELLTLAPSPNQDAVTGLEALDLEHEIPAFDVGRALLVVGDDPTLLGGQVAELCSYKLPPASPPRPVPEPAPGFVRTLGLDPALTKSYKPGTLRVYLNVVGASHGETLKEEVIGSGDASVPFQTFRLSRKPLSLLPSPKVGQSGDALTVRVSQQEWSPVDGDTGWDGARAADRVYEVDRADDDSASVRFGDGTHGSRLVTGKENVRATYRIGIGTDGNVLANRIQVLRAQVLGVTEVRQPMAATGGVDKDDPETIRTNAPLLLRQPLRLVSVLDHEDFARAWPGVRVAEARIVSDGTRRVLFVTVAGQELNSIGLEQVEVLRGALEERSEAALAIDVANCTPRAAIVQATITYTRDFREEDVLTGARTRLLGLLGFSRRTLGQSLTRADVLAALGSVPGIVRADVDGLLDSLTATLQPSLHPRAPWVDRSDPSRPQLAGIDLIYLAESVGPLTPVLEEPLR